MGKSKSQVSTEYLIIFGAIIVVAIVALSALEVIPSFGEGVLDSKNKELLKSQHVSVESYSLTSEGTTLNLQNNLPYTVGISSVTINSTNCASASLPLTLKPNRKQQIVCTNITSGSLSERYELDFRIDWVDTVSGLSYNSKDGLKLIGIVADEAPLAFSYSLTISDTSDSETVYANYSKFSANFNYGGTPVTDANCSLWYNKTGKLIGNHPLTYNAGSGKYEVIADGGYLSGHIENSPVGTYEYLINCTSPNNSSVATNTNIVNDYSTSLSATSDIKKSTNVLASFTANYTRDDEWSSQGFGKELGRVIWQRNLSSGTYNTVRLAKFIDLDSSGYKNQVVSFGRYLIYDHKLRAYNSNGSLNFNYPLDGQREQGGLSVGDIDGDSFENDIFSSNYDSNTQRVINETGELVWYGKTGGTIYSTIGDLNGDCKDDLAAVQISNGLMVYDSSGVGIFNYSDVHKQGTREIDFAELDSNSDGVELVLYDYNGKLKVINRTGSVVFETIDFGYLLGGSTIDLDNDGIRDEFVVVESWGGGDVSFINKSGSYLHKVSPSSSSGIFEILVLDLDDDGFEDDVIYHDEKIYAYSVNLTGASQLWTYDDSSKGMSIKSDDLDADGLDEILVGASSGDLFIFDKEGNLKWNFTTGGSIGWSYDKTSGLDVSDVNLDGIRDVAVGSGDGNTYIIQEVGCVINFSDSTSYNMTWNETQRVWTYDKSFSTIGNYDYTITCSKNGYATSVTSSSINIYDVPDINSYETSPSFPLYLSDFNLTANVTDFDNDLKYVNFTLIAPNGTFVINNTNGTRTGYNFTSSNYILNASGTWNYRINVTDNQGYTANASGSFVTTSDPPVVNLVYPLNLDLENGNGITFVYNVSSLVEVSNCSLYVNDVLNATDLTITKDVNQTFSLTVPNGTYTWNISCFDETGLESATSYGYFNMSSGIVISEFLSTSSIAANTPTNVSVFGNINWTNGESIDDTFINVTIGGEMLLPQNLGFSTVNWWNLDWYYRKKIDVAENSGGNLENYAVKVIVDTLNLINDSKLDLNCSDIRVVDSNDVLLDYWVDNCNDSETNLWVEINLTASLNDSFYLYYGNLIADSLSNASNVFDIYFDLNKYTVAPEGGTQDVGGNGDILEDGRTIHVWGNSWKTMSGFGTFNVYSNSSQILELKIKSSDPGEMCGIGFDTDNIASGETGYKFAGSQSVWLAPDLLYTNSSNWQDVYAIFDDFSLAVTYFYFTADDDSDASGDIYYKDVRIRKYVSSEPTVSLSEIEEMFLSTNTTGGYNYTFEVNKTAGTYDVNVSILVNGTNKEVSQSLIVS